MLLICTKRAKLCEMVMTFSRPSELVLVAEAAGILGLGTMQARRVLDRAGLSLQLGHMRVVRREDVERLAAEREAAARARQERAVDRGGRK